jgi:hypothetical protein
MLLTAAEDPFKPIASTSASPYQHPPSPVFTQSITVNGKGKQPANQTAAPTFVDLPNSAPRSYTVLKEVGDGSFGTVWLADWHSPLECASISRFKLDQQLMP